MEQSRNSRHRINEPRRASGLHKVTVTLGAVALAAVAFWGIAHAVDGKQSARTWGAHGIAFGGPMKMMAAELDLSESQRAQIRQILQASHEQANTLKGQMRGMHTELRGLITSGGYSPTSVRRALSKTRSTRWEAVDRGPGSLNGVAEASRPPLDSVPRSCRSNTNSFS